MLKELGVEDTEAKNILTSVSMLTLIDYAGNDIHYRINTILQTMGLTYTDLIKPHESVYRKLKTLRYKDYMKTTFVVSLDHSLLQDISINNPGGYYEIEFKDDICMCIKLVSSIYKYRYDEAESVITSMMS